MHCVLIDQNARKAIFARMLASVLADMLRLIIGEPKVRVQRTLAEGLDSRRELRALVASGRKRPLEVCSVPLVLRVRQPTHRKEPRQSFALALFWQGQKDSNPRPMVLETSTLPTELYPCNAHILY